MTNPITEIYIHDIDINGNVTNDLFNIMGTGGGNFLINRLLAQNFRSLGFSEMGQNDFRVFNVRFVDQGLVIKNPSTVVIDTVVINAGVFNASAIFSFIVENPNASISLNHIVSEITGTKSLVFFDPNTAVGSSYIINKSVAPSPIDFYQQGVDIAINSVADNGSGDTRFTTAVPHDVIVGQVVVLSGFVTQTTYNKTAIVTAIPTTTTFDAEITFVATDTGNLNSSSLDQTNDFVNAQDNPGQPDSQSLAESRTTGVLTVDNGPGGLVPIVDVTPAPGDFEADAGIERFAVDTSTGIITYIGLDPITVLISYELNAEKVSGTDQDLMISLHINGTPQTKSDIPIIAIGLPGSFGASSRKIFMIQNGDTFQLFLENSTNTTNTNVSKLVLVITKS